MKAQFKKEAFGFERVCLSLELEVKTVMSWKGEREPCSCNIPHPGGVGLCEMGRTRLKEVVAVFPRSISDVHHTALPES